MYKYKMNRCTDERVTNVLSTDYFTLLLLIRVSGVSSDCEMSRGRSSLFWLYIAVKYFVYSEYVAFSFPEIPTIPDFSFDLATAGTSALRE
jgi:hypothetical protein